MLKTAYSHKKIFSFPILFVSFTLLLFYSFTLAHAQDRLPLVVAPARQQMAIDPGESQSSIIKCFNESIIPVSGTLKAVDFIVSGVEGKPILLEGQTGGGKYSASTWISLPYEKAAIPSGAVLTVQFKVNVPKNALPGGRYVAIYFEQAGANIRATTTPVQSGEMTITPRIVGLVNIKVSGPVTESASVREFSAPGFAEFGPIPVTLEIANAGNYHITPQGQVTLSDFTGRQIKQVALEEKNIFPESSRIYDIKVGSRLMIGKFKLTLNAAYGETGQVLTRTLSLWVFPWKLALAIILGITIIILSGIRIWKGLKGKQEKLEAELKEEISEVEELKEKFKDTVSSPKP